MSTKIEWAEETWNPVTGCTPISEGCQNCYAKRMSNRLKGRCGYDADNPFKVTLHPKRLDQPLRWKKPRKIFVCSMGDLFHEDVSGDFLYEIWGIMAQCPQHIFMVLTKRPEIMRAWYNDVFLRVNPLYRKNPLPNIWLGVTAENQARADERIPVLLQIPAAVRFVSVEPMLGPVDLTNITMPDEYQPPHVALPSLNGFHVNSLRDDDDHMYQSNNHLDWVICGGETGPGARPMHPYWVRSLRDQCQAEGVPFFFKSWGDWCAASQCTIWESGKYSVPGPMPFGDYQSVHHVGKKNAGRLLDGREWAEYPGVRA